MEKLILKSFLNQFNTRSKLEGWREEVKVNILKMFMYRFCRDVYKTYYPPGTSYLMLIMKVNKVMIYPILEIPLIIIIIIKIEMLLF